MNYDFSWLEFVEIWNFNLVGFFVVSFGNFVFGVIILVWFDFNVIGVIVDDGMVIYEVCFNVFGNNVIIVVIIFGDFI